jgi:adenosine deaminase
MKEPPSLKRSSNDSVVFQNALKEGAIDLLRTIPKTDFHNHSFYGTRLSNIREWVGHPIPNPPLRMQSLDDMHRFSREYLRPHILNRRSFEFLTESAVKDATTDGVLILEMSLDVGWLLAYDKPDQFFEYVSYLIKKYESQIDFRPEIGILRQNDPSTQIPLAKELARSGLFMSIDIYGIEDAQLPSTYRELYHSMKRQNIKLKAHVGEFGNAQDVAASIDILQLDEIQHGISAATSNELMREIRKKNIRLNICPTSNVVLGRVSDLAHHPIRKLFDNGVRVSINTDDLAIFDQSVSEELLNLYKAGVFTASELDKIRVDALES